ncbi:MAG: ribosome small subunit-dependent GTPase A [Gemmatimonadales bacterium]
MSSTDITRGRVLRAVGGIYQVELADGTEVDCALRGRLKRIKRIGKVAVGDVVGINRTAEDAGVIETVAPRRSRLARRSADGRREQIIAANVEQLAAVFSVARPEPVFELIDRTLVLAEASDIGAFLVVNKIDLVREGSALPDFGVYEEIGYPVLHTSARSGLNLGRLAERLAGHLTLLVGPSGTGKSSLLNGLQPGLGLRIGEISRSIERGRHTTVTASLHRLEIGGYVGDTPGLGKLQFWEVGTHELDWCFPEFRTFNGRCRFPDCWHIEEPDCAVKQGVEEGTVSERRYGSYRKILMEQGS